MHSQSPTLPFDIYKTFQSKHTRAGRLLEEVFSLTGREVYERVRYQSRRWQRYKFIVKAVEILMYSSKNFSEAYIKEVISQAVTVWDDAGINYCPPTHIIHEKYLTNVKWIQKPAVKKQRILTDF